MSLKENVDYIKHEISAEESYLENFFKFEKFYKKYKKVIFAFGIIIVTTSIGYYISDYISQKNKLEANVAFNTLQNNPNDKNAKMILKTKNPKLYEIFTFEQNKNPNINVQFFKELSLYSQAISKNNIDGINKEVENQEFLLKDFALFNEALIQAKEKKYKDAKETLKLIPTTSNVAPLSKMLEHFLITK